MDNLEFYDDIIFRRYSYIEKNYLSTSIIKT